MHIYTYVKSKPNPASIQIRNIAFSSCIVSSSDLSKTWSHNPNQNEVSSHYVFLIFNIFLLNIYQQASLFTKIRRDKMVKLKQTGNNRFSTRNQSYKKVRGQLSKKDWQCKGKSGEKRRVGKRRKRVGKCKLRTKWSLMNQCKFHFP